MAGKVRLEQADRSQVRLEAFDLEELVPKSHRVRAVWAFVTGLDLARFHDEIRAREGHAGRPAIDPAILLCLWLYATLDEVGSARELERLTTFHHVYRWICGGVRVNHHTLSDFRVGQAAFLDELLTRSVVALMDAGVTGLDEIAQDGLRTRAAAGGSSFRRRSTLESKLAKARERVERLKAEVKSDPAANSKRRAAAEARAARQAQERARAALAHLEQIDKRREARRKKHKKQVDKQGEPRASLTDPEARVIKMADGGFRPGYNLQVAMDTASGAVVGVGVSNDTSDAALVEPMIADLDRRFSRLPKRWLGDYGFAGEANVKRLAAAPNGGVAAYMPLPKGRGGGPAKNPKPAGPVVEAWRARMNSDEGKAVYKRRCLVEWVNAGMRNRGLTRLTVRGQAKALAVLLWQALAHNLLCLFRNKVSAVPAAA